MGNSERKRASKKEGRKGPKTTGGQEATDKGPHPKVKDLSNLGNKFAARSGKLE